MKEKKYYSLYSEIKNKIIEGTYKAGEKIPSKRVMADKSGYSLITVEKAYDILQEEGYIVSKKRKGFFVCTIDTVNSKAKTKTPFEYLPIDNSLSSNEAEHSVWFKTVRKVISDGAAELFSKAPNKGCAVFRNALADYLLRYRGMHAEPQRIIIGSGAEQLYESVVKLLGREKIYGIENPSYSQIHSAYTGMGANVCLLSLGADGIESEELSKKRFDVLHVTPFHSYPSGISTSISKRSEYLKWSKLTGNYIIEDDFDSEFFMPGHPIETLYSLDGGGESVIYINTFSKSLSPSMRIGYMILPEALLKEYDKKLGNSSCSVPVFDQYILAEFISSGNFERHLNRIRRKMNKV